MLLLSSTSALGNSIEASACDETQGGSHSPVDPGLASGALCRGTCGEDCHENACSAAAENTTGSKIFLYGLGVIVTVLNVAS
ncbi:MAG: hypothetical protein CVU65_16325 [Deltaproteobacteria bacterium HGW-Deltaproteobacteria-22]|jgi:hypothetical protein|nr:MAG: hypothetical protein CVU65_16325 [Deltaproteobacteria bacterium HGW-Deltaproteobacteria-22]